MDFNDTVDIFRKKFLLGKKNAEKLLINLITNQQNNDELVKLLLEIKEIYSQCPICFSLAVNNSCLICSDQTRDKSKICIVTDISNVFTFEKLKFFSGMYHVLNYEINIKNNITPEKITFSQLENRFNDKIITEVIIAVSATFDGEITTQYIKQILAKYNVKITRLAYGIPLGGTIDYIDDLTLSMALKNRREI